MKDFIPKRISEFLREECRKAQVRNPRLSIRAYARFLGVSPTHLNQILSRARLPSRELLEKILSKVTVSAEMRHYLCLLVDYESAPAGSRAILRRTLKAAAENLSFDQIIPSESLSRVDYEHLQLLAYIEMNGSIASEQLKRYCSLTGVTRAAALRRLADLHEVGLLTKSGHRYLRSGGTLVLSSADKNQVLRKIHRRYLARAKALVETRETDSRFLATEFVAVPKNRWAEARALANDFLNQLHSLTAEGDEQGMLEVALHLNYFSAAEFTDSKARRSTA